MSDIIKSAKEGVKEWDKFIQLLEVVGKRGEKTNNPDQDALNLVMAKVACSEMSMILDKSSSKS